MVRSHRNIDQDILLPGEKGRRGDEPTGESPSDNPEQAAGTGKSGDAVRWGYGQQRGLFHNPTSDALD